MQAIQSMPLTVPVTCQLSNLEPDTWHPAFSAHIATNYPNSKTSALIHQHLRVFALWYEAEFGHAFDAPLLTHYDLVRFRSHSLDEAKVKARTWNSRLWALGILCDWLGMSALLADITEKSTNSVSDKHRALTDNEYHRLIHALELIAMHKSPTQSKHIDAVLDWASVYLMLHGLRVEECSHVELRDLDIDHERSGSVLIRSGKGDKERKVPLHAEARTALRLWRDVRPASASESLFCVSKRTLQRNVEQLGAQIGVPDLTCHWLRYTFAKRLERNGTPIETIRDLLGHNSIETTRRYLRSSAEELQSAVEGVM
jgi:integrase/recombinase XerD